MTASRLWALAVLLAALWCGPGYAQSCSLVAGSQNLAFNSIDSDPTTAQEAAGTVRVQCTRSLFQLDPLKVCIGLGAASTDPASLSPRRMGNGTARLDYGITSAAPGGVAWGSLAGAGGGAVVHTVNWALFEFTREFTVSIHGRLAAGQSMLPVGPYSASVPGSIASSTNVNLQCGSMPVNSTFTVSVTGTIVPECSVIAEDLNFGTRNALTTAVNGSTTIAVKCTPAATYSLRLNGGSVMGAVSNRRMAREGGNGAGVVRYQLYQDSSRTQVWGDATGGTFPTGTGNGTPRTFTVYGRVDVQATPVPGVYKDVVTATVEY